MIIIEFLLIEEAFKWNYKYVFVLFLGTEVGSLQHCHVLQSFFISSFILPQQPKASRDIGKLRFILKQSL